MKKKTYEGPSVEVFVILEGNVLLASGGIGGDILDTNFEYDNSSWS